VATEPILAQFEVAVSQRHRLATTTLSDYWTLTKPEINFLIAITTAAAFFIASPATISTLPWMQLLHSLLGTMLVASGAASLNQLIELRFDAQMKRTARRPLASGRLEPSRAFWFGFSLSLLGVVYLGFATNALASLLALFTLLSYLFLYTPLKRITPLCTLIGAVPGAVPPLIGWAAVRGRLDPEAWVLFAILFLWQFPHFMAIAWMYRDDYDHAGYLVLPRGEARSRLVILQTLLPLAALVLVSVIPALAGPTGLLYSTGAVLLGLGFFYYGAQFALRRSAATARRLLMTSILYIPLILILMIFSR